MQWAPVRATGTVIGCKLAVLIAQVFQVRAPAMAQPVPPPATVTHHGCRVLAAVVFRLGLLNSTRGASPQRVVGGKLSGAVEGEQSVEESWKRREVQQVHQRPQKHTRHKLTHVRCCRSQDKDMFYQWPSASQIKCRLNEVRAVMAS